MTPEQEAKLESYRKACSIIAGMPQSQKEAVLGGIAAGLALVGIDQKDLQYKAIETGSDGRVVTLPGVEPVW